MKKNKSTMKKLLLPLIIPFLIFGQDDNDFLCLDGMNNLLQEQSQYPGCMDMNACNYEYWATEDDGSCLYPGDSYVCCITAIAGCCTYNENCQENCDWNWEFGSECGNTSIDEFMSPKRLIKSINILGKETTNKGFQLNIYDDGSVEKKYIVK
ncbi:MAG: hypothetical protein CMD27_01115 [Flavobacteriales bacterium]|nr:hypothetical protein [Flavobacteriales bacterium]|tara:strand:+ start:318 stop:776 length:459 start_codon:yes stop_codon:yes gene_type:complete